MEFGDATDMEELPHGNWWIFPPPYRHTINRLMHFEVPIAWLFLYACRAEERDVRVSVRATQALQLDFGVFLAPLRRPTRGSWLNGWRKRGE